MRIAIVDDNSVEMESFRKTMHKVLSERSDSEYTIVPFTDADTFLKEWERNGFEVVIFDIFIEQQNGVDLAKTIRLRDEKVKIVFCSSSNDFAAESYEVNASYYLTKPVTEEGIYRMLQKLDAFQNEMTRTIQLQDGNKILINQIVYTEYFNHVISIHCKDHMVYSLRSSQMELLELLSQYPQFYSPTRGVILNFHEVVSLKEGIFLMSDGKNIQVARRKKKETEEAYMSFRFQKLMKELKN